MKRTETTEGGSLAKRPAPELDFKCSVGQPQTARMLVDMVGALVSSCQFEVKKSEEFTGILVQCLDSSKTCIVHARLECEVHLPGEVTESTEPVRFAVSLKEMMACMRVVHSHYVLEVCKERNSDSVQLISRDQVHMTLINSFNLGILHQDYDSAEMNELDYDYTVRIDLLEFRSILKLAKDLGSSAIQFKIYERKRVHEDDPQTIVFCLAVMGIASSTVHYFPSTVNEGGVFAATSNVGDVEGLDDTSKWTLAYSDMFAQEKLSLFVRAMERSVLTLRVSSDKPLVVLFPLGGDDSYVCYILAAKIED